jgi:tripartite-type tricarboxylate transporter receptor subunit TctC
MNDGGSHSGAGGTLARSVVNRKSWPRRCRTAAVLLCLTTAGPAAAIDDYPTKPVRLLVSGVAGSSNFTARLIAQGLSVALGQQFVVDGREGGVIVSTIAAQARPDGYTLLLNGNALWLLPFMQTVSYDPVKSFAPVSLATAVPNLVVVHPSVPAASIGELVSLARAQPGKLNCATGNLGTSNHLAAEMFKVLAKVDMLIVPYKGAGPALNDLMGGQVQLMFPSASSAMPHVAAGRLRALAVTSVQPSPLAPGLPTVSDSGVPGYESVGLFGILAPAGTPGPIVRRLNAEIVKVLNQADVRTRFMRAGSEVVGSTPEAFEKVIRSEMGKWEKVIRSAGLAKRNPQSGRRD